MRQNYIKKTIFINLILLFTLARCDTHFQKGPARYANVSSMSQAKERMAFAGEYEAKPFEYEDSVFYCKIVFSDIYAVYSHWYDDEEKTWKHTKNKHLEVDIDTVQSYGIDKFGINRDSTWYNVRKYLNFKTSCQAIDFKHFYFSNTNGFEDTLSVPVYSSCIYDDTIGNNNCFRFLFGEIIFIRKIDTVKND